MGSMSIGHWAIVLVIILLMFGTKRLRSIGSDLGSAVKGWKDALHPQSSVSDQSDSADALGKKP